MSKVGVLNYDSFPFNVLTIVSGNFYFFIHIGYDIMVSVSICLSILPVIIYSNAESEKETAIKENKNKSGI